MKKCLLNSMTIFMVAIMSLNVVSCSKGDDNGLDNPIAQEIIGTWYSSDKSINRNCTVNFYSDGTGDFYSEYHGKYGSSYSEMRGNFTWRCEGNKVITYGEYLYIDYNDDSVDTDFDPEVVYTYNGSTLTGGRYSGYTYYKEGYDPYNEDNMCADDKRYVGMLENSTWKPAEGNASSVSFYYSNHALSFIIQTSRGEVHRYSGKWSVSDGQLHMYMNSDDMTDVGMVSAVFPLISADIVKLTDSVMQLRTSSGNLFTYIREQQLL